MMPGEVYGPPHQGPSVTVPGYFEAVQSITYEAAGQTVFLRRRDHGRLGTIVQQGHPVLKGRMNLFRALQVPVDFAVDLPPRTKAVDFPPRTKSADLPPRAK